ncbi:MAG TPA: arginine--tRNA ligase [Anaerolineae bacterium]|nr:arginine--tRNA ligase [Anaerolineae bacterium]
MLRNELEELVRQAVMRAQEAGGLPATVIPDVVIERPKRAEHGDYACSLPLKMVGEVNRALRETGQPTLGPVEIGTRIAAQVRAAPFLGRVESVPPGFLNVTLHERWLAGQVEAILGAGDAYGTVDLGHGARVQVEFGSINPTGPLHVGAGRNLALGDTLANLLAASGYRVEREYYLNDAGTQMDAFGASLYVRYCEALGRPSSPDYEVRYLGRYIADWAAEIAQESGDRYLQVTPDEAVVLMREAGLEKALGMIRRDCEQMNIHYDRWFSERSLYGEGLFETVLSILREAGHLYEADGALWFDAVGLGADKNEVVIRASGVPGYFASDIAYHYDKFVRRGFDQVIDVWGADHQGHVPRMKAMMKALGLDPERLVLYVYQLVTLVERGEQVRLSKRAGTQVNLRDLLDDIGADAVRFFLISRTADSQMELDLDLARTQSDENPVFYIQYGHARIASILRHAQEMGHDDEGGDCSLLSHPSEMALVRKLLELPEVVSLAAAERAPHHLPRYAQELAATFHAFYRDCRVVSSDPADAALTKARLRLAKAAKLVLGRTLGLMGVGAPERM